MELDRLEGTVWLGTFQLAEGDQVSYDVSAKTGPRLQIGFAQKGAGSAWVCYNSVSNLRQEDGTLEVKAGAMPWASTMPNELRLFVRAGDGALTGVKGTVTILKAADAA